MHTNHHGLEIILKGRKKDYTKQIIWAENKVDALVYVPLNNNQFSALVSLCVDVPKINAGSRIIKALNAELYFTAADEFEKWKGFRRKLERKLFLRPCLVANNIGDEKCRGKKA